MITNQGLDAVSQAGDLTLGELAAIVGGADGDQNGTGTCGGDGLGKLRQALGGGVLGDLATVVVTGVRTVTNVVGVGKPA